MSSPNVFALVLAGGAGTRFWPASRSLRPKQLLPLGGGRPLIVETVERLRPILGARPLSRVLVATGAHLASPTAELLPGLPPENMLVEPVPRNTAPCIAWAAFKVARREPDAVIAVLPSDHHIADPAGYAAVVRRAVASAASGAITTIGVRPTHAETGFGYIEVADAEGEGARPVVRFVEKPDRKTAEAYVAGGRHLWNAGMFFFRASDMASAVRAHLPELVPGLERLAAAASAGAEAEADAAREVFPGFRSVSIDYGVMEKVSGLAVVPGSFGWSDLGSFQTAWELAGKDAAGNAAPPSSVLVDAERNFVLDLRRAGGKRVVALVGVSDLVVVETDDALLVVPRERAQDVKAAVDALKARGDADLV